MPTISVTFSTGAKLTRNTNKPYTHAWMAQSGGYAVFGLTTSAEKAKRTARTYFSPKEWEAPTWEVIAL